MYWNRNLFPGLSGGGSGGPTDQLINGSNTVTLSTDGNLYFNNGTAIAFSDKSAISSGEIIAPPGGSAGIYSNSFNQIVFAQDDGAWIQTSVDNGGSLFNNWNFDLSGRLILPSAAIDPQSQAGTSIGLSGTIVFPDGSIQTTAYISGSSGGGTGNISFSASTLTGPGYSVDGGRINIQPTVDSPNTLALYPTVDNDIHIFENSALQGGVTLGNYGKSYVSVWGNGGTNPTVDNIAIGTVNAGVITLATNTPGAGSSGGSSKTWTYGTDGVLTTPDNSSIKSNSGSLGLLNSDGNSYIDIQAGGIYLYTDYENNEYEWHFGTDGSLTLPGIITLPSGQGQIGVNSNAGLDIINNTSSYGYVTLNYNNQSYVTANSTGVQITTVNSPAITWTYSSTNGGTFTLPTGGTITEGTSPAGIGNAITLTPAGGSDPNQQLLLYPTVAEGNHLHLTTGALSATSLFLGNDSQYARTRADGAMVIGTGDSYPDVAGYGSRWTFDTSGALTLPNSTLSGTLVFPDGSIQTTAYTGGGGGSGASGYSGISGYSGAAGAQGAQGAIGNNGPMGASGYSGANGAQGTQGAQGTTGAQGAAGTSGYSGPTGPAGNPAPVPYLRGSRNTRQAIALSGAVVFNTADADLGQGYISLNTSTGVITLSAGYTYSLRAEVPAVSASAGGGQVAFGWVNNTTGAQIGSVSPIYGSTSNAAYLALGGVAAAIITPGTTTNVSLQLLNNSAGNVGINGNTDFPVNTNPWFEIQVAGQGGISGFSGFSGPGANQTLNTTSNVTHQSLSAYSVSSVNLITTGDISVGGNLTAIGGIRKSARVLTTTATLTVADASGFIEFAGSGAYTVTLPDPTQAANSGIGYRFWQNTAQNITLSTPAGNFYGPNGNSTNTKVLAQATTQYWDVWSDGYNWAVFGIKTV